MAGQPWPSSSSSPPKTLLLPAARALLVALSQLLLLLPAEGSTLDSRRRANESGGVPCPGNGMFTLCGAKCTELSLDPFNCGACGNECAPHNLHLCRDGLCQNDTSRGSPPLWQPIANCFHTLTEACLKVTSYIGAFDGTTPDIFLKKMCSPPCGTQILDVIICQEQVKALFNLSQFLPIAGTKETFLANCSTVGIKVSPGPPSGIPNALAPYAQNPRPGSFFTPAQAPLPPSTAAPYALKDDHTAFGLRLLLLALSVVYIDFGFAI